ncbi:hypothetical protein [Cryptosporangium sp. NPDC051539]|uniref:hypothetical protein n=1 Tax=Cryptosporangium sp. NPDC051539 TaxID=3363962 RepID=UPI0037A1D586
MTDRPEPVAEAEAGPLVLRWGVLVLWIQAALVAVLAIIELVQLIRNGTDQFEWAAWIIAGPLVAAAALFYAGRLLVNRKPAGRGLAVAIQLSAVPVVFFMITGDSDAWVKVLGAVIGASVIACVALVTAPASRRAIGL